jgi:hypothetical protein
MIQKKRFMPLTQARVWLAIMNGRNLSFMASIRARNVKR